MNQDQAQRYFASIPAAEQAAVRASGANILDWANASESAGDPRALAYSGVRLSGGGDTYAGPVATGGAPAGEWFGKRKPTPAELRAYSQSAGWSEDYARFSDAQLADWISRKWDVQGGYFTNDFGDIVQKPTESGPNSNAAGYATGEQDAGRPGGGGGYADAAPAATSNGLLVAKAPQSAREVELADLQRVLEDKFLNRTSVFGFADARTPESGVAPDVYAKPLTGGGLWWGADQNMFAADNATGAPAAAPVAPAPRPQPQTQGKPAWAETVSLGTTPAPAPVSAQPSTGEVGSPLEIALKRKYNRKIDEGGYNQDMLGNPYAV